MIGEQAVELKNCLHRYTLVVGLSRTDVLASKQSWQRQ